MDGGDLDYLLKNDFLKLPFEQQLKIKSDGRPTPKLQLKQEKGGCTGFRRCFSEEAYVRTEWLAGSENKNKLFCWPCILFDRENTTTWVRSGFADLKNLPRATERHGKSKSHITASLKLKLFGKVRIDEALSQAAAISVQRHNDQVSKNRDILRKLIDAVIYLGTQELSFRGHDESATSQNRGNFVELVHLLAEFDQALAEHLGSATVFRGMSSTIQNEIIESIASVIQSEIDTELNSTPFIAVQVDDTTDIACKCQLTIIVRYVNDEGKICERFLGFFDVSLERNAESLTAVVMRAMQKYNPAVKLICQTYDGASCMSGQHSGVRARVQSQCPYALFIHCYAHKLNLVLSQGIKDIQDAKVFFASLDSFHNFFSRSAKRTALLAEVDNSLRVPGTSATRWNFRSRAVHAIQEGQGSLGVAFDRIIHERGWDNDSIAQSTALKNKLHDFKFIFLLNVFTAVFSHTEILFQILQSKSLDLRKSFDRINATIDVMKTMRSDTTFQSIYDDTVQSVGEGDHRRKRPRRNWADFEEGFEGGRDIELSESGSYRRLYFEIMDAIIGQLSDRFTDMKKLSFFRVLDNGLFREFNEPNGFPVNEIAMLSETYPFFDQQRLRNELQAIYEDVNFHKAPTDLLQLLLKDDLASTLPEVCKLLKLMLTIPVTSVSAERSFSCLKRLKTYLRNATGQDRLSSLATLSMESKLLKDLKTNGHLYDRVIEKFATMKERRMEFLYR